MPKFINIRDAECPTCGLPLIGGESVCFHCKISPYRESEIESDKSLILILAAVLSFVVASIFFGLYFLK
jgi:hypothetical protein